MPADRTTPTEAPTMSDLLGATDPDSRAFIDSHFQIVTVPMPAPRKDA